MTMTWTLMITAQALHVLAFPLSVFTLPLVSSACSPASLFVPRASFDVYVFQ